MVRYHFDGLAQLSLILPTAKLLYWLWTFSSDKKLYLFYIVPSFTFVVNHRACALRKKVHVTYIHIIYIYIYISRISIYMTSVGLASRANNWVVFCAGMHAIASYTISQVIILYIYMVLVMVCYHFDGLAQLSLILPTAKLLTMNFLVWKKIVFILYSATIHVCG